MADLTVPNPCGQPIPINLPLPKMPPIPGIPDLLKLLGLTIPFPEFPTVCPLVEDLATRAK
jgi:hypothetical protein